MRFFLTILVLFVVAVALVSPILSSPDKVSGADGTLVAALGLDFGQLHVDPECPPSGGHGGSGGC